MLRTSLPAIAVAASLLATPAGAATAAGTVTSVDPAKHTVTLDDGMVYTTSPTTDLSRIQVGYTVKVTFNASAAANSVSALEVLSPREPSGY